MLEDWSCPSRIAKMRTIIGGIPNQLYERNTTIVIYATQFKMKQTVSK
jgi:hypothetical protein